MKTCRERWRALRIRLSGNRYQPATTQLYVAKSSPVKPKDAPARVVSITLCRPAVLSSYVSQPGKNVQGLELSGRKTGFNICLPSSHVTDGSVGGRGAFLNKTELPKNA